MNDTDLKDKKLPADRSKKTLTKAQNVKTNDNYGKKPEKRSVEELFDFGIINLDKPANPTSHEVVAWVKRLLKIPKAGHGGTLDPKVTGCLPIALGRSTRAVRALLPAGKEYVTVMHLHSDIDETNVKQVLEEFTTDIYQIPPVRSSVRRRLRVRTIYYIKFLQKEGREVLFRVGCQAGTYIRKLCNDIGLVLGTGAHMKELRRTRSGPFSEKTALTLHDLHDACHYYFEEENPSPLKEVILPIERAFDHLSHVVIRDSAVAAISHGAKLTVPGVVQLSDDINKGDLIVVTTLKGEVVSLAKAKMTSSEILSKNTGICAVSKTVLLPPNTYPKEWK